VAQAFARLLRRRAFSARDALPVDFGQSNIELAVGWQPSHRHTASGAALEEGHVDSCARYQEDINAYRQQTGWDD